MLINFYFSFAVYISTPFPKNRSFESVNKELNYRFILQKYLSFSKTSIYINKHSIFGCYYCYSWLHIVNDQEKTFSRSFSR
jgi:hypothetical protein